MRTLVVSSLYLTLHVWVGINGALMTFLALMALAAAWRGTWRIASSGAPTGSQP